MMETGAGNHFECGDQYDDVLCLGSVTDQEDVFEDCCTTTEDHETIKARWEACRKNPGHSGFISVDQFKQSDLPEGYQDPDIVQLVNDLAFLVVKINVRHTSLSRPARHDLVQYPGHWSKNTGHVRTGSGRVWDVYPHKEGKGESRPCECSECFRSVAPKMSWGEVNVLTAKHVVFDNLEGQLTTCYLKFDGPDSRPVALAGQGVGWNSLDEDVCYLRCVSHDLGLIDRLKRKIDSYNKQCEKVYEGFKNVEPRANLVAVVSHPHGWYKRISFGRCSEVEKTPNGGSTYEYTASTCSGSSGAPVYNINKREARWATHQHSKGSKGNMNKSGTGWL